MIAQYRSECREFRIRCVVFIASVLASNLFIRSQCLRSLSFENLALPSMQPAIFLTGMVAVGLFSTDLPPLWLGAELQQNYS